MHTLKRLATNPASLTTDYLAGRRAAQSSPFRMVLVICLLFFLVGDLGHAIHPSPPWFVRDKPGEVVHVASGHDALSRAFAGWFNPRFDYATNHQAGFREAFDRQFHMLAIIFLPISTLILALLFWSERRFVVDHAIFSMHSLSFLGLLATVIGLLSLVNPLERAAQFLFLIAPVHLYRHMRGVYRTSAFGTLARMVALFVLSLAAVLLLLAGDFATQLSEIGPT